MKNMIIRILRKASLLKYFNLTLTDNGIVYPIIGGFVEYLPKSEQWMKDLLSKILPKFKGCFVDVGVNIGQTLIKIKQIEKTILI